MYRIMGIQSCCPKILEFLNTLEQLAEIYVNSDDNQAWMFI